MSGTHFYLTLPSNVSLDVFPDNKTSEYRVKLPQPVELDGNWEVGLYSIFTQTPGILYEMLMWTRTSITLKALDGLRWQP